ncbi:MAG: alpha/beta hydrolase [Ilumatobacteraceae bacterium]
MPQADVNTTASGEKISLEYETFGSPADPALLLIMGFTAQMTLWPEAFCSELAECGRFVIRFDNRDCGLSTKLDGVQVDVGAVVVAALAEDPAVMPAVPYTLSDMATDAVGLLDHLGIAAAHIAGASMGGMIAQTFAIEHSDRTLSLISIMSTTGEPEVSTPSPEAGAALLAAPPTEREAYIESAVGSMVWKSKKYGDLDTTRVEYARDYDRSFYPDGSPRQLAAIYASGRRTDALAALDTPTLVIHGRDDTLIPMEGGLRTSELVSGSKLLLLADMGHDLPEPLWPTVIDAIISHTNL